MSLTFNRPLPEDATPDDIERALDEITEWDWQTGYSFAHIVIYDRNLDDHSILYCLHPNTIQRHMVKILEHDKDASDLPVLELSIHAIDLQHMVEVVDLLWWLYRIPEEVRGEVT